MLQYDSRIGPAKGPLKRNAASQRRSGWLALETRVLSAENGIAEAASILRAGGLVSFPTETVYGLGADARDDTAVARIFEAKGRPRFNPLIVHVAGLDEAFKWADISGLPLDFAQAFWPGPLTLVVPRRDDAGLSDLVTAGLQSVAIRVPEHPIASQLLTAFGGPVAAPSANRSGRVSPTTADHVLEGLDGRIDAVVDGGNCPVGLESTILGFEDGKPVHLRPGGIPLEILQQATGLGIEARDVSGGITAPGQLSSHYAPSTAVRLSVESPREDELWLGFGPGCDTAELTLSASGNLVEAAANLFSALRDLDKVAKGRRIAVAPVPETGLGLAINDRLRRAAAPRS